MGGLVIFSDTHFVSQHLDEQIKVVSSIFRFAKEHRADAVIHDGDVFEAKNRIDVALYNAVWSLFHDFTVSNYTQLVLNTGNHDIISLSRESSLKPFSTAVSYLVTYPIVNVYGKFAVTIVPYGMDYNHIFNTPVDIFFTHELIDVFTPENYKGNTLKAKNLSHFPLVMNGHIHKPAQYENIYNIGSTTITDFGEEGEQKRFLYVDEDYTVHYIPIDCPQYITIDGLSDKLLEKLEKNNRDQFRINISPELLSHPIFKKANVKPNVVKMTRSETRLSHTTTVEEEMKVYVEQSKTSLNKEKLLEVGNRLLNRR
jgi:DNA repair exonuclease SbcCD nuclease subunit